MEMTLIDALNKVIAGQDLTEDEMIAAMTQIMEGQSTPVQLGAFLTALRMKGESVSEIVGAARVMREKAVKIAVDSVGAVDTCGTGGDGADTFNISTAAAFVAAGAGATVAKHGNRAVSSQSGSADVLRHLGVNIEASPSIVEKCLREARIGFLFAPMMHDAMKHAAPVRKELGIRTLFNILGPLTNPAGAHAQVVGIYDKARLKSMALALRDLGSTGAFVVHGEDGLDEMTMTGSTFVCELHKGKVKEYEFDPRRYGFHLCKSEDLKGGTVQENADLIREILEGGGGPCQDVVVLNAAAALLAAGLVDSWEMGVTMADGAIECGAALKKLEMLVEVSNSEL